MRDLVRTVWSEEIVPRLVDYVRIPNKSPLFDPQWRANGHMDRAVDLISSWCRTRPVAGLKVEVVRLGDRTPVILMEIPGTAEGTVLLYGHLDKQPEMTGWADGLGPWEPVLRDGRLYGRGAADDGYAAFASLTAMEALGKAGLAHARCVILIEACEESGSFDLPAYIEHLADRIGTPDLVVCLDSGCGNYDQLWCTTSLRGLVSGDLHVEVLEEGVHSGDASGIVPSSFSIVRTLLDRVEESVTGAIRDAAFHAAVPEQRQQQAMAAADALGDGVWGKFPLVDGMNVAGTDNSELVLNRTWRPALSVTGAGGLPTLEDAGNVLRPRTSLKLSMRLPPGVAARVASERLRDLLTQDPPYGARVSFEGEQGADGWNAPTLAGWLEDAADHASREFFGRPALYMGEGGSIPFMAMLGERFPDAQFLITGVLGPGSNAHGPNEFLELATAERLTCCVARIIEAHGQARAGG